MNYTVAVVIINWNGQKLLKRFLPSVINFSEEAKIYIIDNFSTDNSIQFVNKNYPKIKIINLNKNYGYAEGYNLGLKHVKEDIHILLNNDIEVTKNWIKPIIENFKHNNIDIAQPLLLDLKNPDYFDYSGAGGGFIDKYGYPYCRGRIYDKIEKNLNQYNNTFKIFWASGACFIIRKKIFNKLNGFDNSFFMHQEEIDLCWRAFNQGFNVFCIGESHIYHKGASTLSNNYKKDYFNFRNSLLTLVKNFPRKSLFSVIIRRFFIDFLLFIFFLIRGKFLTSLMIIKSYLYLIFNFKKVFNKRTKIFNPKKYYEHKSIIYEYLRPKKDNF